MTKVIIATLITLWLVILFVTILMRVWWVRNRCKYAEDHFLMSVCCDAPINYVLQGKEYEIICSECGEVCYTYWD